jgi:hypothetical protein
MADTSDTPVIDEVRNANAPPVSTGPNVTNITNFFSKTGSQIVTIIVYFMFSGILLYMCKVGQSNILPSDINLYPYTSTQVNVESIQENIFTTFNNPPTSMKINFPYANSNNSKNILLNALNHHKTGNSIKVYFVSILETLIHFNYMSLNFILSTLNKAPEIALVFLGPIIYLWLMGVLLLVNNLYFMYLWFAEMKWFFKKYNNNKWDEISISEPVDYGMAWFMIFVYFLIFIISFFLGGMLFIIPFVAFAWTFFSIPSYESTMNSKPSSVLTIIKGIFKYYKVTIMVFISLLTIMNSFSILGTTQGIVTIVVIALIYFFKLFNLFHPINEDSLSKLSSNKQARKSGASMSGGNKNINTHTNKNILTNIKQLSSYLEKHK